LNAKLKFGGKFGALAGESGKDSLQMGIVYILGSGAKTSFAVFADRDEAIEMINGESADFFSGMRGGVHGNTAFFFSGFLATQRQAVSGGTVFMSGIASAAVVPSQY